MFVCPSCRESIPEDSLYCDQCGTPLMYCPACARPKRGKTCPACGEDLVSAADFFKAYQAPQPPRPAPPQAAVQDQPQGTMASTGAAPQGPVSLDWKGTVLPLREGRFGRKGGVYPEFARVIYISSLHGELRRSASGGWEVKDLGSTNGTFISGRRLTPGQWYPLAVGDILKIATEPFDVV